MIGWVVSAVKGSGKANLLRLASNGDEVFLQNDLLSHEKRKPDCSEGQDLAGQPGLPTKPGERDPIPRVKLNALTFQ